MAKIIETELSGVFLMELEAFDDRRGYVMETFRKSWLEDRGIATDFIQHNQSVSSRHVLRGLHYQLGKPQAKLIRVRRGRVWDVIVDVRRGSCSFGRWIGMELSEDNRLLIYVPEGFAHGFLVLSEEAEFDYACSDYYDPDSERGIAWNCPKLGIEWPIPRCVTPILSDKDGMHAIFENVEPGELPEMQR